MKKIILFSLLLTSILYSDAKIYMGLGGGVYQETMNDDSTSITANMARLKFGYGIRESFAVEFSLDYIDNQEELFAPDDGAKYGLNVELIKAFDWGIYINPYVKAGFGMGYMDTAISYGDDSLSYGTYNLGLGMFIPINEHLDIEIAYDYKYINYQRAKEESTTGDTVIESDIPSSMSNAGYIGLNVRF